MALRGGLAVIPCEDGRSSQPTRHVKSRQARERTSWLTRYPPALSPVAAILDPSMMVSPSFATSELSDERIQLYAARTSSFMSWIDALEE